MRRAACSEAVRQDAREHGNSRGSDRRLSPDHVLGHSKPLERANFGEQQARPRHAAAGGRAVLSTPGTPAPEFALPTTADHHGRGHTAVTVPQESRGLQLDPDVLARVQADTDRVTALLAEQFEQAGTTSGTAARSDPPSGHPARAGGPQALPELARACLDPAHDALLRGLTAHARWSRQAFSALCEVQRLLPGGAVDTLNKAAFETCGEPLLDGYDPIDINQYALQELQK